MAFAVRSEVPVRAGGALWDGVAGSRLAIRTDAVGRVLPDPQATVHVSTPTLHDLQEHRRRAIAAVERNRAERRLPGIQQRQHPACIVCGAPLERRETAWQCSGCGLRHHVTGHAGAWNVEAGELGPVGTRIDRRRLLDEEVDDREL